MDFNYDKKQLKKLKQLGLTDSQIDNKRLTEIIEYLLDYNCGRMSKELGKTIKYANKGNSSEYAIYLVSSNGRYCEFYTKADDVALHYESALYQIRQEIETRFYYII